MSLDRALDGVPFSVDLFRCHQSAMGLGGYRPPAIIEPWSAEPIRDQLAFKVLFISICHQMNWDVLQSALAGVLFPNTIQRLPFFSTISASTVAGLLRDYPKQERVRARQRAAMLRDSAIVLQDLMAPNGALEKLLHKPVLEGPMGFYDIMTRIPAFVGDPLDKKARVLAQDLYREKIMTFEDPENLRPAVEYHLIRLYLRSGRVYPTADSVRDELTGTAGPARPRLVRILREKVDEAMRATAFYAGLDAADLNYVEWQIARAVCIEDLGPEMVFNYCLSPAPDGMPSDVSELMPKHCPFSTTCRTLHDPTYSWFREPQFAKAIY